MKCQIQRLAEEWRKVFKGKQEVTLCKCSNQRSTTYQLIQITATQKEIMRLELKETQAVVCCVGGCRNCRRICFGVFSGLMDPPRLQTAIHCWLYYYLWACQGNKHPSSILVADSHLWRFACSVVAYDFYTLFLAPRRSRDWNPLARGSSLAGLAGGESVRL